MKHLAVIVLLAMLAVVSAAVIAGCVEQAPSSVTVTPTPVVKQVYATITPTITQYQKSTDPIIGIWLEDVTTSTDGMRVTYTFSSEGNFSAFLSNSRWKDPLMGKWKKFFGADEYLVTYPGYDIYPDTFMYDPATDTLTQPKYSGVKFYRSG